MNGVAAEVAVEVLVLFEHDDIDALAREEESEHNAGRSSAYDADCGVKSFIHEQLSRGRFGNAILSQGRKVLAHGIEVRPFVDGLRFVCPAGVRRRTNRCSCGVGELQDGHGGYQGPPSASMAVAPAIAIALGGFRGEYSSKRSILRCKKLFSPWKPDLRRYDRC
jgi:hypothetical protein